MRTKKPSESKCKGRKSFVLYDEENEKKKKRKKYDNKMRAWNTRILLLGHASNTKLSLKAILFLW